MTARVIRAIKKLRCDRQRKLSPEKTPISSGIAYPKANVQGEREEDEQENVPIVRAKCKLGVLITVWLRGASLGIRKLSEELFKLKKT